LPTERHPVRGYFYIAAAALFFALSAALGKAAFTGRLASAEGAAGIDPLILAQTRTTLSFLVLLPLLGLRRGWAGLRLSPADFGRCLLLGIFGFVGANYFYYLAIEMTTVATAIILQYVAPVWVLLYMVARGRQRATLRRVGAVGMAVSGVALVVGLAGSEFRVSAAAVVVTQLAALAFAFYNVYGGSLVQRIDRWQVITYALLGAAVFWAMVNPPWKVAAAGYTAEQWGFLALFAATSMLIPFSLYTAGLQHLDATRAIVTSCLEPVFATLIAAAFLAELLAPLQVAGMFVVLAGSILVQVPERKAHGAVAPLPGER
jgi:drug/metabolite transporter (DMT)-like permease